MCFKFCEIRNIQPQNVHKFWGQKCSPVVWLISQNFCKFFAASISPFAGPYCKVCQENKKRQSCLSPFWPLLNQKKENFTMQLRQFQNRLKPEKQTAIKETNFIFLMAKFLYWLSYTNLPAPTSCSINAACPQNDKLRPHFMVH